MRKEKKLKENIPEFYKKAWMIGIFGAAIGGCIGGYIAAIKDNYIYAGLGAVLGIIASNLISLLWGKTITLQKLVSMQRKIFILFGALSLLLAIAGLVGFFLTGKSIGVVGAAFFLLCTIFFLKKKE